MTVVGNWLAELGLVRRPERAVKSAVEGSQSLVASDCLE